MRTPNYTHQFERDLQLAQRRGKDIEKLKQVVTALINEEPLAERYRDHPLKGNYKNRRECHLEPAKKHIAPAVARRPVRASRTAV